VIAVDVQGTLVGGAGGVQLILAAAADLFARRPYEEVSLGEVATRAGAARTLVHHYFKDKPGLYVATLTSLLTDLDRFVAPTADEREPEQVIRGTLGRYFEYVGRHPNAMMVLIRAGQQDPDLAAPYENARQMGLGRVLSALNVAATDQPSLLRTAVRGWMGFTDAVAGEWLARNQDLPISRCVDLCFDALISAVHSAEGHRPEPVGLARMISQST
jgi:AcrR family transcriptional regulator